MDRAIAVGLDLGLYDMQTSLNELSSLAEAVHIKVVDKVIQKASLPNARFYIGTGKVEEIKTILSVLDIELVIFDDVLSPGQIRNLEKELEVQIMDRSFLILSIFSERAKTKEAVLEVSLAQQKYMLPRLIGLSSSLSRQGGGSFNAKGAGETKLELDRRRILQNITKLEKELKKIQQEKDTSRKKRSDDETPIVALVGYTNVGKSATLNTLIDYVSNPIKKDVFEKNMLFATLETYSRRIKQAKKPSFILSDTVGFVSRLPHELVKSFESTLSEVTHADLILHVMDGSTSQKSIQEQTTLEVLKSLKADDIPKLKIYTKKDLMFGEFLSHDADCIISNKTKENIETLFELIYQKLFGQETIIHLRVPYKDNGIIASLEENTTILKKDYDDTYSYYTVRLYEKQINDFKAFLV
ncbi:MAG: GTPase HflX [Acholeplasma sp.]|nr:GTPase HflX [Acholeplasma sp.]